MNTTQVEEILETLSNCVASPDVTSIMTLIGDKQFEKLKRTLKKHINETEIDILISHYKSLAENNFTLVELSQEEFKPELDEFVKQALTNKYSTISKTSYVVRLGADILSASLCNLTGPPKFRINSVHFIDPKKVDQIWKAIRQE